MKGGDFFVGIYYFAEICRAQNLNGSYEEKHY